MVQVNLLQKTAKEVSLYPVPTAGRGESEEEKVEPAVGTRLVQLIFCKNHAKEVSLYYSLSKKES
ncbi:hypothetical protein COM95_05235 [Bacillus cereus]|nr:hypothetical protein COM95_05235 [Bacillus cereus]PFH76512.1 hypothetical protein COI61_16430 [Bacillus cereus]